MLKLPVENVIEARLRDRISKLEPSRLIGSCMIMTGVVFGVSDMRKISIRSA